MQRPLNCSCTSSNLTSLGITLASKVELGLDTGLIVLVPVKKASEICWKIILTDKKQGKDMVTFNPDSYWKVSQPWRTRPSSFLNI
jgi:hypothetical protein